MIYEVRNYHFDPSLFDEYKAWVRDRAGDYLKREFDLVGFWVNTDIPTEINGEALDSLGSANVTWIIRWQDIGQRNEVLPKVLSTKEWREIFSSVPGGRDSYHRRESKFMEMV